MSRGGLCNGQVLRKFPEFPEILGELSMRKQCVPGSFFSAHTQEPGNEANSYCITRLNLKVTFNLSLFPGSPYVPQRIVKERENLVKFLTRETSQIEVDI